MNCLNYETAMMKYGVSDLFMSELSLLMLKDSSLSEAKEVLFKSYPSVNLSLNQLYVLATSIASSIMGEDLDSVCPRMHTERLSLKSDVVATFKFRRRLSAVNEASDLDDILEEIESAIFELSDLNL